MSFDLQALRQALCEESGVGGMGRSSIPQFDLESAAFPEFKIYPFNTVSSTNTVAWELLQQGTGAGTVVIALTQQAGRGQRGHEWYSAEGGLYLSLGLTPDLPIAQATVLTLGSAWGIATALQACAIPVQIKWLNDLVVAGRKLGGILTETRTSKGRIHQAVIGVGINWQNPVPAVGVNLQTIQFDLQKQSIASLERLAAIVLQGLRLGYVHWQQHGIESLIAAYESLLVNRGDEVAFEGQPGKIIGVTSTGQLRVQLGSSPQTEINTEVCLEPGAVSLGYGVCSDTILPNVTSHTRRG